MSYDANGNLTSHNGYTFGWTSRRLSSAVSEDANIAYTYNHNGIRTTKTVNGVTTYYDVDENNNVVKQYELVNDVETNVIEFVYDSNGSPIYFTYNNATYYYEKNLQGDIVGILNIDGNLVVTYKYDAWGKVLTVSGIMAETVGTINPMRYRDYYLDTETGYYYLQSRYCNPDICRFINADEPNVISLNYGNIVGANLFAYCDNNPIMNVDPSGFLTLNATVVGFALDVALTLLCSWVKGAWDIMGSALKIYARKKGYNYFYNYLLTSAVPKWKGMFSTAITWIRKAIWRATGATLSNLSSSTMTSALNKVVTLVSTTFKQKGVTKALDIAFRLLSTGSAVALFLDWLTDKKVDNKIRI